MSSIVLTPNVPGGVGQELADANGGIGIWLDREGNESLFPPPSWDRTFGDSPDTEGGRRLRSRPQNPSGAGRVLIGGATGAQRRGYEQDWQETVSASDESGAEIVYTPNEGTPVTYLVEAIALTSLPHSSPMVPRGISICDFEVIYRPYGLLAAVANYPLTDSDPFNRDTFAELRWRQDAGGGTIGIAGGLLDPSAPSPQRLYRPYKVADADVTLKVNTSGSGGTRTSYLMLKRLDATNYLVAGLDAGGDQILIRKVDAGVISTLGTPTTFTDVGGETYWVRFDISGNVCRSRIYDEDPHGSPAPAALATCSHTLSGGNATKYGSGVWGNPGLALETPADYSFGPWRLDAPEIRSSEPAFDFELRGVPGSAPARSRIRFTDKAGQNRSHAEWGMEHKAYDPAAPKPVLFDSSLLSSFGFAGYGATISGASGRENLITNPRARLDVSGWTNTSLTVLNRFTSLPGSPAGIVPTGISTAFHAAGDASADRAHATAAVVTGKTYRFSAYVYLASNTATGVRLAVRNAADTVKANSATLSTLTTWTRLDVIVQADATETWKFAIEQVGAGGADWYWTAVLVDEGGTLHSYYEGNAVQAALTPSPLAVIGYGAQQMVGTFRHKARVRGSAIAAEDEVYVRLAYKVGASPNWQRNDWVKLHQDADIWAELDLGIMEVPEPQMGTQSCEWQIEGYSTDAGAANLLAVDYDLLLPAPTGKARTPVAGITPTGSGGTRSPGTLADDSGYAGTAWTNPSNAASSNDVRATCVISGGFGGSSHYLKATNFGFAIPSGATITGVLVEVERSWVPTGVGAARTGNVRLGKTGAVTGVAKGPGAYWGSSDAYESFGGESDLWGAILTPSDVNGVGFGVYVSASSFGTGTLQIDHIRLTVYYSEAEAQESVLYSTRSLEVRSDGCEREAASGEWGPIVPYGAYLELPPCGREGRASRIVVKARRNDVDTQADDQVADELAVSIPELRPRVVLL